MFSELISCLVFLTEEIPDNSDGTLKFWEMSTIQIMDTFFTLLFQRDPLCEILIWYFTILQQSFIPFKLYYLGIFVIISYFWCPTWEIRSFTLQFLKSLRWCAHLLQKQSYFLLQFWFASMVIVIFSTRKGLVS